MTLRHVMYTVAVIFGASALGLALFGDITWSLVYAGICGLFYLAGRRHP